MTSENFEIALHHVLAHEGGYVNHPRDPGGETNYGITRRTARSHGYMGSMRSIPMAKVRKIYLEGYWDVVRGDDLPSGLDYAVFDFAVNSGPARAVRFLCSALGIPDRSIVNSNVIAEADRQDIEETIRRLCSRRLAWLKTLSTWRTFGRGWSRRVLDVERDALAMVENQSVEREEEPRPKPEEGNADASARFPITRKGPFNER